VTAAGHDAVSVVPEVREELTAGEFGVVAELRDRVSTRLSAEDRNYAPEIRRELTKKLIRDEYSQWLLHEASSGRAAPPVATEDGIFAAVLADLDGLGRLAPLLARGDVEDIHFEGSDPTMLRLASGEFVPGPPIAASDEELEQLLRSVGARAGDGQTSREFSSASPVLNLRLRGVSELGARLQAAMDVLPRPAGVIRVPRFSDPSLDDLHRGDMLDSPLRAFLHYSVVAGVSVLVSGAPGVGKTTVARALGDAIPYENVVVTVEDERELGLHLPRRDPKTGELSRRHAVSRSFESRLANAEGMGAFGMGDALHLALRASPTWVVVGEVRGA
jgi:pilus assembly protein CpaF